MSLFMLYEFSLWNVQITEWIHGKGSMFTSKFDELYCVLGLHALRNNPD